MANYDIMLKYIQHDFQGSVYKDSKTNKFDFSRIKQNIDHIFNLLYYTYHGESEQLIYKLNNAPNCLNDIKYNNYYIFRIQCLFHVKPNNFAIKDTYVNTKIALDGLNNFDIENTFVIRYEINKPKNKNSFAVQALKSLRNTFAHGGFNIVIDDKKRINFVCLNNYNDGISFSFRYFHDIFKESTYGYVEKFFGIIENVCNDLTSNNYVSNKEIMESNLNLLDYKINEIELNYVSSDYCFKISKRELNELFIECNEASIDNINTKIEKIFNSENIKKITTEINKIKLYLPECSNNISKENLINIIRKNLENESVEIKVCKKNENLLLLFDE